MKHASYQERFWEKVIETDGCWLWVGAQDWDGYGKFRMEGRLLMAHRVAYEWCAGPIPNGLTLDHLCRVTSCVRPEHLEPVSLKENILRGASVSAQNATKTHCPRGHPYNKQNTYLNKGSRICRACGREKYHERKDC